ncbi:NAD(+) diphosphatase [Eionea flava]
MNNWQVSDVIVFLYQQQLFYRDNILSGLLRYASLPPSFSALLDDSHVTEVGIYDNRRCFVADVNVFIEPEYRVHFRSLMSQFSDADNQMINRALQLTTWNQQHQFCGQCGRKTKLHSKESALHCASCDLYFYPKILPCMMCLVVDGDYCLLAQHEKHRGGFYSTLAGFVEAGETVEQTVHREVMEEVGLTVDRLDYFSSQAWPFPHQLMIGYFARYLSGDITIDDEEIADAQWFHYSKLPKVSSSDSLSGVMINAFVAQRQKANASTR